MDWQSMETVPRDGTWVLAINNRGNCAVIIWSESAHDRGTIRPGWIHPFSTGELSVFWNGASHPVAWCKLPHEEDAKGLIERFSESGTKAYYEEQRVVRALMEVPS